MYRCERQIYFLQFFVHTVPLPFSEAASTMRFIPNYLAPIFRKEMFSPSGGPLITIHRIDDSTARWIQSFCPLICVPDIRLVVIKAESDDASLASLRLCTWMSKLSIWYSIASWGKEEKKRTARFCCVAWVKDQALSRWKNLASFVDILCQFTVAPKAIVRQWRPV